MRLYTSPQRFMETPTFIRDDVPVWYLEGDCYFDDTLFMAGTVIETEHDFEPNVVMFPLNKISYDIKVQFLTIFDQLGEEWSKKENKAYVKKLAAFEHRWKTVNDLVKQQRKNIVAVLKAQQAPILGAPTRKRSVTAVDTTVFPQDPFTDGSAVGKGNTMDKNMNGPMAVRGGAAA